MENGANSWLKQPLEGSKPSVEQTFRTPTLRRRALGRVKGPALVNDFLQVFRTVFPNRFPVVVVADFLHDLLGSAA